MPDPATPASDTVPLPVLAGKRSNGRPDRTGNPQTDRAVRAAKTTAKAPAAKKTTTARKRVAVAGVVAPVAPVAGRTAAEKNAATRKPRAAKAAPAPKIDTVPAARDRGSVFRAEALAKARTAPNATVALAALHTAALHRNDRIAQPPAGTKPLAPLSATTNALGTAGDHLQCYGACGLVLPVARFPYVGQKATATGRYIECGPDQTDRLEANKVRKAAGLPTVDRPRATDLPK